MITHHEGPEAKYYTLKRYLWMADLIYKSPGITLEEIQYAWLRSPINPYRQPLPERTFFDHKKAIEGLLEVDIVCDRSTGGRYRFEHDPKDHSFNTILYLLDAFSSGLSLHDAEGLKGRIIFDDVPSAGKFLTVILDAICYSYKLKITYQSFNEKKPHTELISPYCLRQYERRWYLLCDNPLKEPRLRIYSLDRMQECRELYGVKFELPIDFSGEAFFSSLLGVSFTDRPPQLIRIKSTPQQAKYLKSLPLHSSQMIEEETEAYTIFSYYLRPTFDLKIKLLSLGHRAEILSPADLREEVIGELRQALDSYETHNP